MKRTLVIGLGNPILGDDGVGWKVAEQVSQCLESEANTSHIFSSVEVNCVSLGGLSLMERMVGYQRVIIIDAMQTGQSTKGIVRVFGLEELPNPMAGHTASTHDTSLITALDTARTMGLPVPESVEVVAIEAENVYDFSEELSPAVAEAVPVATQTVFNLLKMEEP